MPLLDNLGWDRLGLWLVGFGLRGLNELSWAEAGSEREKGRHTLGLDVARDLEAVPSMVYGLCRGSGGGLM
jgi:hypothetical protein